MFFIKSFLNLFYPSLCLHCHVETEEEGKLFCSSCVMKLEVIDASNYCPLCFSIDYDKEHSFCTCCVSKNPLFNGKSAVFDYEGPASTWIKGLKYAGHQFLAKQAGAYLTTQLIKMEWPLPDIIVPVPIAFNHWVSRGYNQSFLLAKAVGEMIDRPVSTSLTRKSGDYSQAGLNHKQRKNLENKFFLLKSTFGLKDKIVLLIDDVMTTGSTLNICCETLWKASPKAIYALTLCKSKY